MKKLLPLLLITLLFSCKKQDNPPLHQYDVKAIVNVTAYYEYKYGVIHSDGNKWSTLSTTFSPNDYTKVFQFHDAFSGDSVYFTATFFDTTEQFTGDLQIDFTTHVRDTTTGTISLGYKLP